MDNNIQTSDIRRSLERLSEILENVKTFIFQHSRDLAHAMGMKDELDEAAALITNLKGQLPMLDNIEPKNNKAGVISDSTPSPEDKLSSSAFAESLQTLLLKLDGIQAALDRRQLPEDLQNQFRQINTALTELTPKVAILAKGSDLQSLWREYREEMAALRDKVNSIQTSGFGEEFGTLTVQANAVHGGMEKLLSLAQTVQGALTTTLPNDLKTLEDKLTAKLPNLAPIQERLAGLSGALASLKEDIRKDTETSLHPVSAAMATNWQNLQKQLSEQISALQDKIDALHSLAQTVQGTLATTLPNGLKTLEDNLAAKLPNLDPIQEQIIGLLKRFDGLEERVKADTQASLQPIRDTMATNDQRLQKQLTDQANTMQARIDSLEQKMLSHAQATLLPSLNKLGEQLSSANAALTAQIKTQSDQHKTDLGAVQKQLLGSLAEAEKKAEEKNMSLMGALNDCFGNMLSSVTGNADKLQKSLEEQNNTLSAIQQKFDNQIQSLTEQQAMMARDQSMAENKLREVASSLATVEKLNGELQSSKEKLENEIADLKTRLEEKKDEIATLKSDLTASENKISQLNASHAKLEEDAQNYRSTTGAELQQLLGELAPYAELRDAMLQSPSFQELAHQQGIDGEGNIGLLACMRSLGESLEFLNNVHDWAKKVKLDTKPYEPLKADEKKVYAALNNCYRKLWQIDFDVFQLPGGQNVLDDFHIVNFVREEVTSLENPRDTNMTYTKDVYVPKLINRAGAKYKSALVKAGNDK